jgi:hypothetical protein
MSNDLWHDIWINTLIAAGISKDAAEDVFKFCFGNQEIDLSADPRLMAQVYCSGVSIGGGC